ncbi:uncharacterized protein LOC9648786 [Selaginella moellendorffii]|nr:uncharacterized protein LOC9648786 [Selaginella moellendorffii]|eukprot:XP_002984966.2 uncharacterized protein LOC9648786 [Selaginella moellendorffii]
MAEQQQSSHKHRSWQRGISPGRGLRRLESKLKDLFLLRPGSSSRKQQQQQQRSGSPDFILQQAAALSSQQIHMVRSGSLIRPHETLAPVREGPDADADGGGGNGSLGGGGSGGGGGATKRQGSFRSWMMEQIEKTTLPLLGYKHSDVRLLLGVLGAPLAPIAASSAHCLYARVSPRDGPIESTSAQYILHQYMAASGGSKFLASIHNSYAAGKIRMSLSEFETVNRVVRTKNPFRPAEAGCFVLWQMKPDMWYVELVLGGGSSKVHAGCDGKLVWRQNPWMGPHAAKGPVRPLRRVLQGLDPLTTATIFSGAVCVGEKRLGGEDCFVLKLAADPYTLGARSDGPAEIIRHVLFGYFSQRTGLLVRIEDSHLTRIQASAGEVVYWETSIESTLDDYRSVDGLVIAHSGHSCVTLFRFGEVAMGHTRTRMEEDWTIEEVALNVPGLSEDCFIPPADIRKKNSAGGAAGLVNHSGRKGLRNGITAATAAAAAETNLSSAVAVERDSLGDTKNSSHPQEQQQYTARVKATAREAQSNNAMWRVEG